MDKFDKVFVGIFILLILSLLISISYEGTSSQQQEYETVAPLWK